jgi:tetratricopeptide (TPR) repeat protein
MEKIKIMINYKIYSLFLIAFFGLNVLSFAQPDNRPSVEMVEIEGILIEAKREVLLENFEDALVLYKSILKKDKKNATAHYEMAKVYETLKDNTKAIESAKAAFDFDKDNEWCGTYYAGFLKDKGDYNTAADVYKSVIKANPKNSNYYFERAYLLTKTKNYEEAIAVYSALETQEGVTERSARQKHIIFQLMGDADAAIKTLEELITIFPYESQHYHALAQYYEQLGKKEKATGIYKRALKMNPDDAISSIALAENNKAAGNEAAYLLGLKPLFNKAEVDIDLKVKELFPYISKLPNVKPGVADALLDLSKTMTEVHSDNPKAFAIYADILYYNGNTAEALNQYEKTLALDNTVFSVWQQILLINIELGQVDAALKMSEDAMDIFPNQVLLYYINGVANNQKGTFDDAIDMLEQAMMMSGRENGMKLNILNALGESYYGNKDYKAGNEQFDAALAIDGNAIIVLNSYSFFLAQNDNFTKAIELIEKANKLAPNEASIQDTYGLIYYKKGEYKSAEKWLNKALENGGNQNPAILEHYGNALFKLNKKEEAVTYWQKAKTLGGSSKNLDKKISEKKLYE